MCSRHGLGESRSSFQRRLEFQTAAETGIAFSIFNVFQKSLPKKIPLLNHSCSRHSLLSHSEYLHEDESPLNSSRETCARDSPFRVFLLFFPVKQHWHSVRVAWNLFVRQRNHGKNCVEVSHPVTAEILGKPEDAWFVTASSRARARVEVNIKKWSSGERAQVRSAQGKKMDQWIGNDVVSVCQRAGIPKERIMTMRWLHTRKVAEDTRETKAKARLVVKSFTGPDLTEVRSESPTLSRLSRPLILQIAASRGFRLRKGDVKTAFLSVDREEVKRDVYAEPHKSCARNHKHAEQVLNLETAVYGLRNAPKACWKRVVRDMTETGWVQHQLDQRTCMFMNGTELVGLIGVYVDDFLVAGCNDDPIFSAALSNLKRTFQWGTWNEDNFTIIGIHFLTAVFI